MKAEAAAGCGALNWMQLWNWWNRTRQQFSYRNYKSEQDEIHKPDLDWINYHSDNKIQRYLKNEWVQTEANTATFRARWALRLELYESTASVKNRRNQFQLASEFSQRLNEPADKGNSLFVAHVCRSDRHFTGLTIIDRTETGNWDCVHPEATYPQHVSWYLEYTSQSSSLVSPSITSAVPSAFLPPVSLLSETANEFSSTECVNVNVDTSKGHRLHQCLEGSGPLSVLCVCVCVCVCV